MTLIEAARAHLGTPFAWGQATPGVGMDCVGLLLLSGQAIGAFPEGLKRQDLAAMDNLRGTSLTLGSYMDQVAEEALADVALVGNPRAPGTSHVIVVGGGQYVTSSVISGRVVESHLDARIRRAVVSWWAVRNG